MSVEVKRVTNTVKEAVEGVKKRAEATVAHFNREIGETHKTLDVVDGYADEFAKATAELRALLGESNSAGVDVDNDPVIERTKKGDSPLEPLERPTPPEEPNY